MDTLDRDGNVLNKGDRVEVVGELDNLKDLKIGTELEVRTLAEPEGRRIQISHNGTDWIIDANKVLKVTKPRAKLALS